MKISGFRYDITFAVLLSSFVGFSPCKPKSFTIALFCMIFQHGIKIFTKIKLSMLKCHTNSGFHELFRDFAEFIVLKLIYSCW